MTTIEVEIPKKIEQSFLSQGTKMTYRAFLKRAYEVEESQWVDTDLDEPMQMKDFRDILVKEL